MKKLNAFALPLLALIFSLSLSSCEETAKKIETPSELTISKATLKDKIKGGWAGQVIGVTYGGSTEFKYNGTFIQDYQTIHWDDDLIKNLMVSWPGLYDDVYMDLTFVEVYERLGLNAPIDSFAHAFANADYVLWHANQAARYNILNGINPPESGHWLNNPHADDIDYQIEADFAGLMAPGMPNSASEISDQIGHIMNYGDGWYGGVYVGAMYSLAFVYDDVETIVNEALKTIPEQSTFYQCMADVIKWHKQYPNDWHQTWFEIQKKWSDDYGCPDGVFEAFNIDAKINAAYVVLGLLYGQGDFTKTVDISTRAGMDSDCNPATAGGILGTMMGYSNIPEYWMTGLKKSEDMVFKYTSMSLNKVYEASYGHAIQVVEKNGGVLEGDNVKIKVQKPEAVKLEQCFVGMKPVLKKHFWRTVEKEIEFEFKGTGFVWRGDAVKKDKNAADYVFDVTFFVDGKEVATSKLTTNYNKRKHDLYWKYNLSEGDHKVKMVINNPNPNYSVNSWDYLVYVADVKK